MMLVKCKEMTMAWSWETPLNDNGASGRPGLREEGQGSGAKTA